MNSFIKFQFCAIFFAFIVSCSVSSDNQQEKLPSGSRNFVSKHFGDTVEIQSVFQNMDLDYEVKLSNGIELYFERKGNWEEMNAKKCVFPASILNLLPNKIHAYIAENYPDRTIRKIERKSYGYRIKLNKPNAVELQFSKNGSFIENEPN